MIVKLLVSIFILAIAISLMNIIERGAGKVVQSGVFEARFKDQKFVSVWNKTISRSQNVCLLAGVIFAAFVLLK